MDLQDIREKINSIDASIKELYAERLKCSKEVATSKLETGDEIYKPVREKEICDKFADTPDGTALIKKIMQISRKYQYSIFAGKDVFMDKYLAKVSADNLRVFADGGMLTFELYPDNEGKIALDVKGILSIIADSSLELKKFNFDGDIISVELFVNDETETKFEALILCYMLYMETL